MTSPTSAFDKGRLARIDTFLKDRYLETGKLPHAQVLVAHRGEIVHFSSQGAARDGSDAPIGENTLFRIASMTKPITSIAFMMLVEEGSIALETPVHQIIPEFRDLGVYAGGGGGAPFVTRPCNRPMLMVDLLRHTSGLTYSFQYRSNIDLAHREGRIESWYGNLTLDGLIAALAQLPLEFSPGEAWNYSVSTDVLGAVIERITGMGLQDVFRTRIFEPLGMVDTFFRVPQDKIDRLPDCWTFVPGKGRELLDRGASSLWAGEPTQVSGGGGLVSSAMDYHRFCRMLLNGGELDGERIIGRKTLDLMTMNHLPGGTDIASLSRSAFSEEIYGGFGFGLGFAVNLSPARSMVASSVGEFNWGGMYSTYFFVDPVEQVHMVFMTQLSPSSTYPVRRELRSMIYAALA